MRVDFLIIGQGICGTFLSWYLRKANYSFIVIDDPRPFTASRVAAGIINPVTGRRIVKTWLIDQLMPFAWQAYQELGNDLGITAIEQKNIVEFFPTPQIKEAYKKRYEQDPQYLSPPLDNHEWKKYFNYEFDCGEINPCYLVNIPTLLPVYRQYLQQHNVLLQEKLIFDKVRISENEVRYKDITASYIIFCDGMDATQNPLFKNLPFAANKGEMLLVQLDNFPENKIFKRSINLLPWKKNVFWAGSSYEWNFDHDQPTEDFKTRTVAILKQWLKIPFKVIDHIASVRPATLERRPFVGFHPITKNVGLLNGMGTKGCSLAPFFAKQLVDFILFKSPIQPEADLRRFNRILSKTF